MPSHSDGSSGGGGGVEKADAEPKGVSQCVKPGAEATGDKEPSQHDAVESGKAGGKKHEKTNYVVSTVNGNSNKTRNSEEMDVDGSGRPTKRPCDDLEGDWMEQKRGRHGSSGRGSGAGDGAGS